MYRYPEVTGQFSQDVSAGRVFFALYYTKTPDNSDAFKRAAVTWLSVEKQRGGFRAGHDVEILQGFVTEGGFRAAWRQLLQGAGDLRVWRGAVFSHASFSIFDGSDDGIEFSAGPNHDGTLKQSELIALPRLPWAGGGFLVLAGCNSGREGFRGWSPAGAMARSQQVPVLGQVGSAYFSKSWGQYQTVSRGDSRICLWAYQRGKNLPIIGSGRRLAGRVYR